MSLSRKPVTASISEWEGREIKAADASGNAPVVFVYGLWLLAGSWAGWADFFEAAGYAPVAPGWPGDPETVGRARASPGVLAGKTLGQVAGHATEVIKALDEEPAVLGHSTGGLVARMLAGRGGGGGGDRPGGLPGVFCRCRGRWCGGWARCWSAR